jgi:hypothetical protein
MYAARDEPSAKGMRNKVREFRGEEVVAETQEHRLARHRQTL